MSDSETENTPPQIDAEPVSELEPTTIVLAKVKGYRPWPAMVLSHDILPENVKKLKPKPRKTKGKPVPVVPVRFFSDNTYIWTKETDLKRLESEEINGYLEKRSGPRRRLDPLLEAYQMALSPPDMAEFVLWSTKEPVEHEVEEPQRKKSKKSRKGKKEEDLGYADYDEFEKELDELGSSEPDIEFDLDWGLDELPYDFELGNYIFEGEEQKKFHEEFPKALELLKELTGYQKQVTQMYKRIAPALLDKMRGEKEVIKDLRLLEKMLQDNEIPRVAFTKSPLFRVLLVMLHRPATSVSHKTVLNAVKKVMATLPLKACSVTEEDLTLFTPAETPAPEKVKGEKGRRPVKVDSESVEPVAQPVKEEPLAESLGNGVSEANGQHNEANQTFAAQDEQRTVAEPIENGTPVLQAN